VIVDVTVGRLLLRLLDPWLLRCTS
jgi:hypothetical protein